jgi:glycosyltransferase involved in cell wall biosynthesis
MIEIAAVSSEVPAAIAEHSDLPHVLLVVDQLSKTLGGAERIILRLGTLLPRYGYRVSILTLSFDPTNPELKSPPCPIYLLPIQRTYDLTALRAALELRQFLKQQNVQIVNTFFESSDIWAGLVTKALSKAKLIWSRRDMGILRSQKHSMAYRLMAGAPDAVFAVSEQVRRYSIEVDRIDPRRVQTIYNGLDLSAWDAPSRPAKAPGEFLITTVGNIRRVKGHDVFIKAAAAIIPQFPKASFSIAGDVLDPEYFAELQGLVRSLGLSSHFRFDGGVRDLRRYLAAADLFVLPSRSEGFSNALVEAMAASLPVVATEVGGNAEAVLDGMTGFIVPAEDPEALSKAIARLLSDPALAKAMGSVGKERASQKFATETMMQSISSAYKELLSEK